MAKKSDNRINIVQFDLGKLPPQAVDIEEAVLGAILVEGEAYDRISISPVYFYKEVHQKIYRAIVNLKKQKEPVDILTVTEELRKSEELDEVGGPFYITTLSNRVASSAHIEYHAAIITEKYILRELIRISTDIQSRAFEDVDPDDLFNYYNQSIDQLMNNTMNFDEIKTFDQLVRESLVKAEERQQLFKEGKSIGIPTPVTKLTNHTTGWQAPQFIIIAARPGHGKTAWALACARKAAIFGYQPAIFSLEMSGVSLTNRLIIGETGIDADNFRKGDIEHHEWDKINAHVGRMMDWKIVIDDNPKPIDKIIQKVRFLHRKKLIDLLIIDYIQLASDENMKENANRQEEVSSISRKLKLIGMELNIPVIALSQLNRDVEKRGSKVPMLADLRESGSLEQDADVVLFLYNPAKYGITEDEDGKKLDGKSYVIIAKQREGYTGPIEFRYNKSITAVYDYQESYDFKASPSSYFTRNDFEPEQEIF